MYREGYCIADDCLCHALHPNYTIAEGAINCDYFLTAVLPTDAELHDRVLAEIYQQQPGQGKTCTLCKKPFLPRGNRQRYCSACSVEAEKKRNAQSHHRQYWRSR